MPIVGGPGSPRRSPRSPDTFRIDPSGGLAREPVWPGERPGTTSDRRSRGRRPREYAGLRPCGGPPYRSPGSRRRGPRIPREGASRRASMRSCGRKCQPIEPSRGPIRSRPGGVAWPDEGDPVGAASMGHRPGVLAGDRGARGYARVAGRARPGGPDPPPLAVGRRRGARRPDRGPRRQRRSPADRPRGRARPRRRLPGRAALQPAAGRIPSRWTIPRSRRGPPRWARDRRPAGSPRPPAGDGFPRSKRHD